MYTDAYLNHYADRYIADRIGAHGVGLEQYLADPGRFDHMALEPEPLLPAQRAVAARLALSDEHDLLTAGLEADLADAALRDGALVQLLHHHRKAHSHWARRAFFRGAA